jgi:hypothetical protein
MRARLIYKWISERLSRSVAFISLAISKGALLGKRAQAEIATTHAAMCLLAMARKSPLYLCGVKILSLSRRKKSRKKHAPTLMLRKYLLIV